MAMIRTSCEVCVQLSGVLFLFRPLRSLSHAVPFKELTDDVSVFSP